MQVRSSAIGRLRCGFVARTGLKEALAHARAFGAMTLVLDVEPLVARWDGGQKELEAGVRQAIASVDRQLPLSRLVLITNSKRTPAADLDRGSGGVTYLARGRKPWLRHGLARARAPIVVIGDQVLTDGLLAWRLRRRPALFIQVPQSGSRPILPRLQEALGRPVRRLAFSASTERPGG